MNNNNEYTIEEFDEAKTKILKYVLYKKRTENEVLKKFENIFDDVLLYDVIDDLKEKGYINDKNYIKRSVDEFISLKNLSMYEIKYKLLSKGVKSEDIDSFFSDNYDLLKEFEKKSARNIASKKLLNSEQLDVKNYLLKKGYKSDSIEYAFSNYDEK